MPQPSLYRLEKPRPIYSVTMDNPLSCEFEFAAALRRCRFRNCAWPAAHRPLPSMQISQFLWRSPRAIGCSLADDLRSDSWDDGSEGAIYGRRAWQRRQSFYASALAEKERRSISERTRAALAAKKAAGAILDHPSNLTLARSLGRAALCHAADQFARALVPNIQTLPSEGITILRSMAAELNRRGLKSPRGDVRKPITATVAAILQH